MADLEGWLAEVTATTASRSSRTPAPRASSPVCRRSAATTRPGATRAPRHPHPRPRARHQRRLRGHGRPARRRRQGRRRRLDRPRGPAHQVRGARRHPAGIMITYLSTHGVYEDTVTEQCLVHDAGGQASTSTAPTSTRCSASPSPAASAGRVAPEPAQDALHPARRRWARRRSGRGARAPRARTCPSHPLHPEADKRDGIGPISAAPYGSAWASCRRWGSHPADGRGGTSRARRRTRCWPPTTSPPPRCLPRVVRRRARPAAHECILDLRPLTKETA